MAERVRVGRGEVRLRSPWAVFVLCLLTAGIYYLLWYYRLQRELRDGAAVAVGPFLSLLALTAGWALVFPPFLSWWRTFGRIEEAQTGAGLAPTVSRPLGFLLFCLAPVVVPVEAAYAQRELNRAWRSAARR